MNLILFIHEDASNNGELFKKTIDQQFKDLKIDTYRTINSFKEKLKQVSNYLEKVFILFVDSKNRLDELTSLIDLMERQRIILILPDNSRPVISASHQFYPRYFTFMSDTYSDLCAVIDKMTINEKMHAYQY